MSIRGTPTAEDQSLSEAVTQDLNDESGMQNMARMVWNYMAATKELVQGLDAQVCYLRGELYGTE